MPPLSFTITAPSHASTMRIPGGGERPISYGTLRAP